MLQLFRTKGKRISQKVHYFSFPCGVSCQFSTGVICPPELGFIPHQRNTNTRTISPHFPLSPLQENSPSQQLFHYLGSEREGEGEGGTVADISNVAHASSIQYQYVIWEALLVSEQLVPDLLFVFLSLLKNVSPFVLYNQAKIIETKGSCTATILKRPNFKGNTVWNVNTLLLCLLPGESNRWKQISYPPKGPPYGRRAHTRREALSDLLHETVY